MHSHCVLQKARETWLPFEFVTFLCGAWNLTRIFVVLHLQMSSRTWMWKMRSCAEQDSVNHGRRLSSNGTHTIICKIHTSRLDTLVRVVPLTWLNWCTYCRCLRKHLKCHFLQIELIIDCCVYFSNRLKCHLLQLGSLDNSADNPSETPLSTWKTTLL